MEIVSLIIALLSFAGLVLKHVWDENERQRLADEAFEKARVEFEKKYDLFLAQRQEEIKKDTEKFKKVWDTLDKEKKKSLEDVLQEEVNRKL